MRPQFIRFLHGARHPGCPVHHFLTEADKHKTTLFARRRWLVWNRGSSGSARLIIKYYSYRWRTSEIRLRLSTFAKNLSRGVRTSDLFSRGFMRNLSSGAFREAFRMRSQFGAWDNHPDHMGKLEANKLKGHFFNEMFWLKIKNKLFRDKKFVWRLKTKVGSVFVHLAKMSTVRYLRTVENPAVVT